MEIWRDIMNYEGWYQISNFGNIRPVGNRLRSSRKIWKNSKGYSCINLRNEDGSSKYLVHRLVAISFLDNLENLPQVNHIDGNKNNNHISNLEWCDQSHNMLHAYSIGLR